MGEKSGIFHNIPDSVVVMDEVVGLNERVDVRMEEVEEDVRSLKGEVAELRNELGELREAHG